jgi:hypothetical protein
MFDGSTAEHTDEIGRWAGFVDVMSRALRKSQSDALKERMRLNSPEEFTIRGINLDGFAAAVLSNL